MIAREPYLVKYIPVILSVREFLTILLYHLIRDSRQDNLHRRISDTIIHDAISDGRTLFFAVFPVQNNVSDLLRHTALIRAERRTLSALLLFLIQICHFLIKI